MRSTCIATACAALASLACAPTTVSTQMEPGVDVSNYATYVQAPPPKDDPAKPGFAPEIGARMSAEIDRVLQAKGYRLVADTRAQMKVAYTVAGQSDTRLVNSGDPDADYYVFEDFTDGTIVIDVFDQRDGKRIWRGTGETQIVTSGSLIKISPERVAVETVRKVLDRFPKRSAD